MKLVLSAFFCIMISSIASAADHGPICDILTLQKRVVATAATNFKLVWFNGLLAGFVSPTPFYEGEVYRSSKGTSKVGRVKGTHINEDIVLRDAGDRVIGVISGDGSTWNTGPGAGVIYNSNHTKIGYVYCYSYNQNPRPSRITNRWMGLDLVDMNIAGAGAILAREQLGF